MLVCSDIWLRCRNDKWEIKVPFGADFSKDAPERVQKYWEVSGPYEVETLLCQGLQRYGLSRAELRPIDPITALSGDASPAAPGALYFGSLGRDLGIIADIQTERLALTVPPTYVPRLVRVIEHTLYTAAARAAKRQLEPDRVYAADTDDRLRGACRRLRLLEDPPTICMVLDIATFLPPAPFRREENIALAEVEVLFPNSNIHYTERELEGADTSADDEEGAGGDNATPTVHSDAEIVLHSLANALQVMDRESASGEFDDAPSAPVSKVIEYLRLRNPDLLQRMIDAYNTSDPRELDDTIARY